MKKTILYIVLAVLCLDFRVQAQIKSLSAGLKIGDQIPDLTINNVINYPTKSVKIFDFKGKLLILDFWATWCSSCIQHFPEMYSLQQKFNNHVQILLVNGKNTKDSEITIKTFFEKRKSLYQFPCVVMDTTLTSFFPHKSLPHFVIIYKNKIVAITDADHINEDNINRFLSDSNYKVFVKSDLRYDSRKPMFVNGNGGDPPLNLYRSMLTGHVDNLIGSFGFKENDNGFVTGMYAINQPLFVLYLTAFPEFAEYIPDRIIYEINRRTGYFIDNIGISDVSKAQFTYESTFPQCNKTNALKTMRADLFRYFHLRIDSQMVDTQCYVVTLNKNLKLNETSDIVKSETNIFENNTASKYFTKLPTFILIKALEEMYKTPFVDETGFQGDINLKLPNNLLNKDEVIRSLYSQGLTLKKEKRKISYIVFSDLPDSN